MLQDNIVYLNKNLEYTFKNYTAEKMTYMKLEFMVYQRYKRNNERSLSKLVKFYLSSRKSDILHLGVLIF